MASDGEALTGLWFDGQKYFPRMLPGEATEKAPAVFEQAREWLDVYFSGREPEFTPKISMKGTDFRIMVWEILLSIPYGKTMTYGEIADRTASRMGVRKMSAQAVGGAVGHNAISIIIPCHRVLGSNGSLTGYAGGLERKAALLSLERTSGFCEP